MTFASAWLPRSFAAEGTESLAQGGAVKVILDADMDSDCDDVGALAVLHALADEGKADILGVMMSDPNVDSPRCTDAINTWYGRPNIPIGVRVPRSRQANSVYARQIASEFSNDFSFDDATEAVKLYRKLLAECPDQSAVIISIGTLDNLADLLESRADEFTSLSGIDLVAQKVVLWSCMGGHYPASEQAESNFKLGGENSAIAIENWPTPILFSGWEIGASIITGREWVSLRAEEENPIKRAYELFRIAHGKPGRPSWDQTSVLAGVVGPTTYWFVQRGGHNHVKSDGNNEWIVAPDRAHGYLRVKVNPAKVAKEVDALMMAKPMRRPK